MDPAPYSCFSASNGSLRLSGSNTKPVCPSMVTQKMNARSRNFTSAYVSTISRRRSYENPEDSDNLTIELIKSKKATRKDVNHHIRSANGCIKVQSLFSFIMIAIDEIQVKASIAQKNVSRIMEVELHEFALINLGQANKMVIAMDMAAKAKAEESVNKNLHVSRDAPNNGISVAELITGLEIVLEMSQWKKKTMLITVAMECCGHSEKRI